ncbi:ABC transporter permease [Saccharibacillus sp. CPCC 101409]|uniref:ABC transporter permease n=1 Tax=Saccharibacillus sp. CPCC 101409 TaxID=3058041 RepID=UPI0026717312|nr:ABC transporter permease [Saccharibacillus sp. CPCC 101409]MDO3409424.1 ABC transporter permease [Saccharibacillus sp. CPCC 101409]
MNGRIRTLRPALVGLIVPVSILVAWQLLGNAGVISQLLFPNPSAIWQDFWRLLQGGELASHLRISVLRALGGFALGGGLGIAAGLLVGLFRGIERTLDPTMQMIRMIPHLAVTALFVLWFGIGETSKILLVAKGAFFPLYINTFLGIRNADNKLFEVSRILGFGFVKRTFLLALPSALPNLFLGIRLSLGVAWLSLAVAELLGSTEGIGYLMMDARMLGRTSTVFVGIALFAVIGKAADSLVLAIERRALRWNATYKGQ